MMTALTAVRTVADFNSLTTKKQTTKVRLQIFKKNVKSKLYRSENRKTGGQTV